MTTAIIGNGGIGPAIARRLAAGGERLRLASADRASAQGLAAALGPPAIAADGSGDTPPRPPCHGRPAMRSLVAYDR